MVTVQRLLQNLSQVRSNWKKPLALCLYPCCSSRLLKIPATTFVGSGLTIHNRGHTAQGAAERASIRRLANSRGLKAAFRIMTSYES